MIPIRLNLELTIDCPATGYPQPTIKLERLLNGHVLENYETGKLKVKYTKDRSGRYRCSAENSVGRIEKEFQVKHYGKATIVDLQMG